MYDWTGFGFLFSWSLLGLSVCLFDRIFGASNVKSKSVAWLSLFGTWPRATAPKRPLHCSVLEMAKWPVCAPGKGNDCPNKGSLGPKKKRCVIDKGGGPMKVVPTTSESLSLVQFRDKRQKQDTTDPFPRCTVMSRSIKIKQNSETLMGLEICVVTIRNS